MTSLAFLQDTVGQPTVQQLAFSSSSASYKHLEWNLDAGRPAEALDEEGPGPSKKSKTGRPQIHYQLSLLIGEGMTL